MSYEGPWVLSQLNEFNIVHMWRGCEDRNDISS